MDILGDWALNFVYIYRAVDDIYQSDSPAAIGHLQQSQEIDMEAKVLNATTAKFEFRI